MEMAMQQSDLINIQQELGLSDGKMAKVFGVTRQTWRNWRNGNRCPLLAQNAIRWMLTIRELSPANDNLPALVRHGKA